MRDLDRRAGMLGAVALSAAGSARTQARASGRRLYDDVVAYAAFGEHRAGGSADEATSQWLARRLRRLGFSVAMDRFPVDGFRLVRGELRLLSGPPVPLFPAWPPMATTGIGLSAPLAMAGPASPVAGRIAIAPMPLAAAGALDAAGNGDRLLMAQASGAAAVIGVTEGLTGAVIAQNAEPLRFRWRAPVALARGSDLARLTGAAGRGEPATLIQQVARTPMAQASNVLARRRGTGKTIVVSTPKSGWFRCAGERGAGIALFLDLARRLARTDRDLAFVATSAHELGYAGGARLLAGGKMPPAESVGLWVHIGANVASNEIRVVGGRVEPLNEPSRSRRAYASPALLSRLTEAFAGQPGYAEPQSVEGDRVPGEVVLFRNAGYAPIVGLVGSHPLHHTPMDLPALATSPGMLAPVAEALWRVVGERTI